MEEPTTGETGIKQEAGKVKAFVEKHKVLSLGIALATLVITYLIYQNSVNNPTTAVDTTPQPVDTSAGGNPLDLSGLSGPVLGTPAAPGGAAGSTSSDPGNNNSSLNPFDPTFAGTYDGTYYGSIPGGNPQSSPSLQDLLSGVYFPGRGNQPGVNPGTFTYAATLGGPAGNPLGPQSAVVQSAPVQTAPVSIVARSVPSAAPLQAVTASPFSAFSGVVAAQHATVVTAPVTPPRLSGYHAA